MKMQAKHFEHMKAAIKPLDTAEQRRRYLGNGWSTTRYQWDLVRAAGLMTWLCDTLYSYLNDTHIQTALNKIVEPLHDHA